MRSLYNNIENAIRQHETILHVDFNVQESDARHAIRWVMRDNPDIFWFSHQYLFDRDINNIYFRYQFGPEKVNLLRQSIDEVVEMDFQIKHVRGLKNQFEQVMYVYKWLLDYCNYNPNSAFNQGIDSVFVRRNSVCTGYAKAAQYLFNLLGIESSLVFGRLNNDSEEGRHCWNIVKVDGKYYHLDICLGDPCLFETIRRIGPITGIQHRGHGEYFYYNYFCVSTDVIRQSRSIEDMEFLPECNDSLADDVVSQLASINILHRQSIIGCRLTAFGSSADIHLCTYDKHVVLKLFRETSRCYNEYRHMQKLYGCRHLLQLSEPLSDIQNGMIAIEQSTPVIDLFCSHYYRPTFSSILKMINDIAEAWLECKARGVLYRDIHICNIYKANDGTYKLGDFGSCTSDFSAKETAGNQWFMAPETLVEGIFDERSAIYAITMVLYFVLNDLTPAFCDDYNEEAALKKRIQGDHLPYPSSVWHALDLELFITRGCAFSPADRFPSMQVFLHYLHALSTSHDILDFNHHLYLPSNREPYSYPIGRNRNHPFANGKIDQIERIAISIVAAPEHLHSFDYSFTSVDEVETYCRTMGIRIPSEPSPCTYETASHIKTSLWDKLFYRKKGQTVYSSVFAPAEIKPKTHLMVQVFLHLLKEIDEVKHLAKESNKHAERRDYIPLQCKLKKGDKVDVQLSIFGDTLLLSEKNSLVWQGSFTKCSFDYFVPKDIAADSLSCKVMLSVNGAMVGEMCFITEVLEQPRNLNPEVFARQYKKIFISYAHQDEPKVEPMARAYKAQGVNYFFDRHYLKPGDIFPIKIQEFIDTADLFILCWSENAAKSDYVELERQRALRRAYPQVKPIEKAQLSIYPMSIEPRAELPIDMKDTYNFEVI